jgi:hypothetical protein
MITKEMEEIIVGYNGILKNLENDIRSTEAKLKHNHLKTVDLMHEADPRNHIEGMPRKRKVDSRIAMSLGLKLKELAMEHRDLKDELELLKVIQQQFPENSKGKTAVSNVSSFVQCGKTRKYTRRVEENK